MRSRDGFSTRRLLHAALLTLLLGATTGLPAQDADDATDEQAAADDVADDVDEPADQAAADDNTNDDTNDEPAAVDAVPDVDTTDETNAADDGGANDDDDDANAVGATAGPADARDDAPDDADDGEDAATTAGMTVVPLQEWNAVPMSPTEAWAPPITLQESEYAIPVDTQLDPTGEDWVAVEVAAPARAAAARPRPARPGAPAPSPAARAAAEDVVASGRLNSEEMPVLRRPQPGTKPPPTDNEDSPYSTGGKPIRPFGAPWQVQIYYPDNAPEYAAGLKQGKPLWQLQHYCGGALIAADWVLTAAHCIDDEMVRAGYRVRVGATDISKGDGISYKIDRIVRHSQYGHAKLPNSPNMFMNDIALIKIVADSRTVGRPDPKQVHPIALSDQPVADDAVVAATGWGKTVSSDDDRPSAVLMRVVMRVMDTERCRQLPGYGPQRISDNVICAADTGKSTCRGDSGGALTLATSQVAVGIVSWGKGRCSGDGQPGAYTRIDKYRGWIKQAMALPPTKTALP